VIHVDQQTADALSRYPVLYKPFDFDELLYERKKLIMRV